MLGVGGGWSRREVRSRRCFGDVEYTREEEEIEDEYIALYC